MARKIVTTYVFVALLHLASTEPVYVSDQCAINICTDATRFVYETGQTYIYDYETRITTNLDGSTDQSSGYFLQSSVHFQILSPCELAMTMHNTKLLEVYDGADDQPDQSPHQAFQAALEQHPLRFAFHDGRIEGVCSSFTQPDWVVNVKKGVLSLFQNSMSTNERRRQKIQEVDVLGTCDTEYILTQGWRAAVVKKTKLLDTCSDHQSTLSAVQANPFMAGASQSLPLIHGTQECEQTITHGLLEKIECLEEHHLRPFSGPDGGGVVTRIQQSLIFTADIDGTTTSKSDLLMRTSLLFQHTFPDGISESYNKAADAHQALQLLCENAQDDVQQNTPIYFDALVEHLQSLETRHIRRLVDNVAVLCKRNMEKGRKLLLDALVQTQTPAALQVMTYLVNEQLVSDDIADWWFFNLGLLPQPTEASIQAIIPLLEFSNVPPSAYLGVSSLVATYCRTQPSCESSAQVLRVINRFEANLGSDCEVTNEEQTSKIILSLKAIGNIGLPQRSPPVLQKCVSKRSLPTELRLAAIQAHRRFSCDLSRSSLLDRFLDTTEDSELRIALYVEVMHCPSKEVINTIHTALKDEPINQVSSFVWTHLTNLQESADLCKADIQGLLADYHLQAKFSPDARKFSRAYEWSFFSEALDVGAHIDSSLVFTPETYLPRSAMLNLTVDLFGRSVNLIELTGRMEGFEDTIESLFGPSGAFPSRPVKDGLRTIREKWNIDHQKLKQLTDMASFQGNRSRIPHATAALKVFGNELTSWSLQGIQQVSQLHDVWNLQSLLMRLATDRQIETTHSAVLLKGRAVLATGAGLPLRLAINSTASVSLSAAGHIDLRRLASRSVEIVGHLSPSGTIFVMGSMSVDGIISQAGMELNTSLHSSTFLDGRIEVRAKELVRIKVNMPKDKVRIINLTTQLYVTQGQWRHAIAGVQADRLDASHCTGALTSRALGVELCSHLSYPNATAKVEAPYFPLTGPAQLQFYLQKTDPGLSSFLLEYRWEKDQVSAGEGKQYQRNFLLSIKTPHSVQDRELTAELIINEADRSLSCRLLSPWKKIVINGQYIFEVEHKKVEATLSIDGRQYLVTTELQTDTKDTSSRLTPRIHVRLPDGPVLSLTGFIFLQLGKKLTIDLRLDHLTTRPIVLVGEVVRSERQGFRRLDWDATFGSPTIESHLQGYLQFGSGAWSATSSVEYWSPTERGGPPVKKHRIDFLAKFRNMSPPSLALTRVTATAELHMTAYPQYSVAVGWTFLNAVGHIENQFQVGLGPNALQQDHQLTLQQVLTYAGHGTRQDNNITARFSVSYPVQGVHCVLRLHHRSTKDATTTEAELHLDPERTLALDAIYHDESKLLAKVHAGMQLHLPTRTIKLQMDLVEERRHQFALECEAQWEPGDPLKIKGLYRNRSTHLQLEYILEGNAQTPEGLNYSIQGHFLAAENRMSVGTQILAQEGQYSLEANLTRQHRGSYHLLTYGEWPGDFYKGVANLTLGGDEKVLSIDAQFGHLRRIHGEAALQHFDDLQSCVMELSWDADRDPSQKMTLNARHRQPNSGEHKGEVYFTHPQRNITFTILSRTYGSWHDGPLSLTSETVLDWGRRLTLNTELQQTTGPNRQDVSVLASANTPFEGFEVLHASATHSADDIEWATQAKIMGPAGKAIHLDTKTSQKPGSNLVETQVNVATPFDGYENITVHAWHLDDHAEVSLGMESQWSHGKRMVIKAYAADTGHLDNEDEDQEENVNMRGGASISSPWTGAVGAAFYHVVTSSLFDSKAEVHWGQEGTDANDSNHHHSLDLKRLSLTMSSRTGQRGPNLDTEVSAHIITPLDGFKRSGVLIMHTTDYSGFQTSARVLWEQDGKPLDDALRIRIKGWHQSSATATNMHADLSLAAPVANFDEVGARVHHVQDWNKLSTNVYARWSPEGFLNASILGHNTLDRIQGGFTAQMPWFGYELLEGSLKHHITSTALNSSIRATAVQGEESHNFGLALGALWQFPNIYSHKMQGSIILETPTDLLNHFLLSGTQIKDGKKLLTHGDVEINGKKAWINHDLTYQSAWHLRSQLTAAVPFVIPCSLNLTNNHKTGQLYSSLSGKWADNQEASASIELRHESTSRNQLTRASVNMDTPFEGFNSIGAVFEHSHIDENCTLHVEVMRDSARKLAQGWVYLSRELIAGNAAISQISQKSQDIKYIATVNVELAHKPDKTQVRLNIQFPIIAVELIRLDLSLNQPIEGNHLLLLSYKFAGNHAELKLAYLLMSTGHIQINLNSSIPSLEHVHVNNEWKWSAEVYSLKAYLQRNMWNLQTAVQLTPGPAINFYCKASPLSVSANFSCDLDNCNFKIQATWQGINEEDWKTVQKLEATITSLGSNSISTMYFETTAYGHERMLMGEASISKTRYAMWTVPWYANIMLGIQVPKHVLPEEIIPAMSLLNWDATPTTSGKQIDVTKTEEWQFSSQLSLTENAWDTYFSMKHKDKTASLTILLQPNPKATRFTAILQAPFTLFKRASLNATVMPNEGGLYARGELTIDNEMHNATGNIINIGNGASHELRGDFDIQSTSLSFDTITMALTVHGGYSQPLEVSITTSAPDNSVQIAAGIKSEGTKAGEIYLVINAPVLSRHNVSFNAAFHRDAWKSFDISLNAGLSRQWCQFLIDFQRSHNWQTANIKASVNTPLEGFKTFLIQTHYVYDAWQHLEAGADIITPFPGYEKFHLFTQLKNKINTGAGNQYIIQQDPTVNWNLNGNWVLVTNLETSITGWSKVNLIASRRLALDGTNYWQIDLEFQQLQWVIYGSACLSILPDLSIDVHVITPYENIGNFSLDVMQHLDKLSYTGKFDSQWSKDNKFIVYGRFATSGVELNISTPFAVFPSGRAFYEYQNSSDKFVGKAGAFYNGQILAAVDLQLLNDIPHAKWRTSIDLHNPWQPVGFAIGAEHYPQDSQYTSELCWDLNQKYISTLTGKAIVHQINAGHEFSIETIHPQREMKLQSRYLHTNKRFAHNIYFQWESSSASVLGYAVALDSKPSSAVGLPAQYEASFSLTSPLRVVEVGGEVSITSSEFGGKANLLWDAGRDRTREAGIHFQLQGEDSTPSSYNGFISFYHPRLEKEVALRGNCSYATDGRELLSLLLEADYSPRSQHRLTFAVNIINEASIHPNDGIVQVTAKLVHLASGLNIQLAGNVTDSNIRSVVNTQLTYHDKYDTPKVCKLLAVLAKENRYAQFQLWLPRDHWLTEASIKQQHTSHKAEFSHRYNDDEQVFAEARINNNIPSANFSIFYGPERNLAYSLTSGLETSRHFVFDAVRHQLTNEIHDALMTLTLPHPFLVNYRLKWKPTLLYDILDNANMTARILIEDLKASWARFRRYIRDEAATKKRRFLATTSNTWEVFMEDVENDVRSMHYDLEQMMKNIEDMYDDNHFYSRQTIEWLQEQGIDVGLLYQYLTNFLNGISKALLDELTTITHTLLEAWDESRDLFNGGLESFLEFILSQGSALGRSVQDHFQQLRRQLSRAVRLLVDVVTQACHTLMSTLSSLRRFLWEKLSGIWARLRAWGEAMIQLWRMLQQAVMDFVYRLRDDFLSHPLYVNLLTWVQSMYDSLAEFWNKELFAALKRHLAIVWEALIDGQSSFIGFLIRQGKWLKDTVEEYSELIRNNVHVVFYTNLSKSIYERVTWVLNYYQLCDNWTLLPLRIYQAVSTLTQRTGYQRGIQYDSLNRVTFSYSEGRVEVDQYLPVAWYALTRWPQVDQLPEVQLYSTLRNVMSGTGPSFWDTFYTYQPYLTSTSTWLPPFPGYAILAGKQHFITFDKAFFAAAGNCTYLLAHDFIEGNFTIAMKYEPRGAQPSLILILGDREAEVNAAGKVTINGKKAELPQVVGENYILRLGSLIVASPARGVFLECNLAFHYCQLRVDGWYFARTVGLFGSYNNEPSDDIIPNLDSASAMSTWEVGSGRCRSHFNRAITAPREFYSICAQYFENRNSIYKHCFKQVDPQPYYQMCVNDIASSRPTREETICTSTAAYVTACHMARILLRTPRSCIRCPVSDDTVIIGGDNVTLHEGHVMSSSDVVLIIEAKMCNQKVAPFLPELVKNIDESLAHAGMVGNRYSVVGFGGSGVYDKPHTHTMDGSIFGNTKVVASALANIAYGDGITDTFTALHFAANLPFRAGVSKTFIVVLCTECQQTSHWVGYQEVYRTLLEDGIHVHLLINHEFNIRNTKDFYGLDRTHAYTVKDARTKNLRGDKDLRTRVVEPKYICIPPALESNGSVFSTFRLIDGKRRTKSFQDVFSRRVARTASPASCQRCDCVPDAFGAGKIHCQPCHNPGSTFLFGESDFYGPDEEMANSGEERNSPEPTMSPSRQKTKGNGRNRKRKHSRGQQTQSSELQNVTQIPVFN